MLDWVEIFIWGVIGAIMLDWLFSILFGRKEDDEGEKRKAALRSSMSPIRGYVPPELAMMVKELEKEADIFYKMMSKIEGRKKKWYIRKRARKGQIRVTRKGSLL